MSISEKLKLSEIVERQFPCAKWCAADRMPPGHVHLPDCIAGERDRALAIAKAVVEECAKVAETPEGPGEQIRLGRTTAQMIRALAADPSGGKAEL